MKKLLSILLLLALVTSMLGSIGSVYAVEPDGDSTCECVCLCDECNEEPPGECLCDCVDCINIPEKCSECDEAIDECTCPDEDPEEPEIPLSSLYNPVQLFVYRLYVDALKRPYDPVGLAYWTRQLNNRVQTGASIASLFFFCEEFYNQNVTNTDYVDRLYRAFLNREPEPAGHAYWLRQLNNGWSREKLFENFVIAPEFHERCEAAGIPYGGYTPSGGSGGSSGSGRALAGKTIYLDPGHGTATSPGSGSYNEAVAMLDLAYRIKPLLEAEGATVILTRENATNVPMASRNAMINIRTLQAVRATTEGNVIHNTEIDRLIGLMQGIISNPGVRGPILMNVDPFTASRTIHPDLKQVFGYQNHSAVRNNFLVISLHSNAATSASTRGAEAYYIDPTMNANTARYYTGYNYTSQSMSFGSILLNHISNTGIPRRSNGLRADNYAITRESNVPTILVENGFHTNATDRGLLSSATYRQDLAVAYRNAVLEHYR